VKKYVDSANSDRWLLKYAARWGHPINLDEITPCYFKNYEGCNCPKCLTRRMSADVKK